NGLKIYEDVLDENWKYYDEGGLCGEWVRTKDCKDKGNVILYFFGGGYYMGCSKQARSLTSFDYRLGPKYQFPAQLCDAVAAYLYLINPGPDSGFEPIDPKKIIFAGSSAGGGLAMGTAVFIRDVGLPSPAGIVLWSPWVDLTSSMPSFWNHDMDKTDHVPRKLIFPKLGPPCPMSIEYLERVKIVSERIKQKKPKVVGHSSFTKFPRIRMYCANEALAIPYVSPMLAESLGNLPPILMQVGGGDRLRDAGVLLSFRASDPCKYQVPKFATENFENSPFKKPTEVTLEVYDEACHCFMPFEKIAQFSMQRAVDFIKYHTLEKDGSNSVQTTINAIAISPDCEIRELDEEYKDCLKYENIGALLDEEE
ncbi:6873_t:CDS:2, partial [Scutellospora calospora]